METIEAILTRKSVRQFAEKEIEQDKLDILLKAAMAAPSGVNAQPWKFIVVKDQKKKEAVKKVLPFGKYNSPIIIIPSVRDLAVVPFNHDLAYCDLSAATENILLAAHDLGLGAVWCAIYPNKKHVREMRKALEQGPTISPFSCIFIGYPSENDKSKVKNKYKENNVQVL